MREAGPLGLALLLKKASCVGAFFMGAIWCLPAVAFCPAPSGLQSVSVRAVVDGDTLRLDDGRSVRLIGINAPEIGRKGKRSEPLAETARRRLEVLVRDSGGRVGLLSGVEPRDKYGRTLAHVYGRSGNNFESVLLSEGLGYRVAIAPNVRLAGCQGQAERAARQAGVGLWRASPVIRAARLERSGFAVVSGKVGSVRRNRGGIWIEVDDALVLQIPAKWQRHFPSSFLSGLKGRNIEARGWVLDRSRRGGLKPGQQRWLLPLTDPGMLERIER